MTSRKNMSLRRTAQGLLFGTAIGAGRGGCYMLATDSAYTRVE